MAEAHASVKETVTGASAARRLRHHIASRSDEIETGKRVPADLVDALNQAGLFSLTIPAALGGSECRPLEVLEAIEELAYADSAVAWCAMIYLTTAVSSAQLPADWAEQIYRVNGRCPITAGATAPTGKARRVDGGLEVTGRWAWGSGTHHADWIVGGCMVEQGEDILRFPGGAPAVHIVFFEKSQVLLHDNWDPSGMRGTGSVDFEVQGVFVPEGRWVVQGADALTVDTALYRFPFFGLFAACVAAIPLGIARRALDDFVELARGKGTGRKSLAESSLTQMEFGQANAQSEAARRFLFAVVQEVWETVAAGGEASTEQRRQLRLAATQATQLAAAAVDRLYNAGGGTSLQGHCSLQRHFRDVHVATQHRMVSTGLTQLAGAMALVDEHPGSPQL
ncbi:MAG: acyl-CoA dehydrogenase family protein [Halieaceae bacterium]|jgi:alkylation response protein AidB-like acyl-CoA dehydrogenase|nr:acyl-CoA dehydrogenase family protein [Halieaceae bacterium]